MYKRQEKALSILEEVFEFAGETYQIVNRRMTYGRIVDRENEQIIDEVLAVYMKGPKTYTAEDVVEINCHGSMVSLRKTLALVLRKGARLAEPGDVYKSQPLSIGRVVLFDTAFETVFRAFANVCWLQVNFINILRFKKSFIIYYIYL